MWGVIGAAALRNVDHQEPLIGVGIVSPLTLHVYIAIPSILNSTKERSMCEGIWERVSVVNYA